MGVGVGLREGVEMVVVVVVGEKGGRCGSWWVWPWLGRVGGWLVVGVEKF